MPELDQKLIDEAVSHLDEILERHAYAFVHLDRGALIERLERIRECVLAAKINVTEGRSLRL